MSEKQNLPVAVVDIVEHDFATQEEAILDVRMAVGLLVAQDVGERAEVVAFEQGAWVPRPSRAGVFGSGGKEDL